MRFSRATGLAHKAALPMRWACGEKLDIETAPKAGRRAALNGQRGTRVDRGSLAEMKKTAQRGIFLATSGADGEHRKAFGSVGRSSHKVLQ
jgi:hypothetical protein